MRTESAHWGLNVHMAAISEVQLPSAKTLVETHFASSGFLETLEV